MFLDVGHSGNSRKGCGEGRYGSDDSEEGKEGHESEESQESEEKSEGSQESEEIEETRKERAEAWSRLSEEQGFRRNGRDEKMASELGAHVYYVGASEGSQARQAVAKNLNPKP